MAKNLVIVESPAKSKTISKILGSDYEVLSSYGHIRDLKTKGMGIDIDNNFAPQYEIPEDKKKVVTELRKAVKKADSVWLASDEDREGEAIAWHLAEALELDIETTKRIVFHEITPRAIKEAVAAPRTIDMQMVNAQQARRVLDRIVGFELSPLLWKKIRPSLSAGRVQSVVLRVVVERGREIRSFVPENSYRVRGVFATGDGELFEAELDHRLKTPEEARAFILSLHSASFSVLEREVKPGKRHPAPPFTTSTLQQEASRKLSFSTRNAMSIAQSLYEEGHITYMRTDSVNLSSTAIASATELIKAEYGEEYVKARKYQTSSKGAQEAHEAIRPTHIEVVSVGKNKREKAFYDLIRKRTLASQMADAEIERTRLIIGSSTGARFVAQGEVVTFDGFLKVYMEGRDDDNNDSDSKLLPKVGQHESVRLNTVTATERFTTPPPYYTEATLVKKMEELGIGRPSTYSPTIMTLLQREYLSIGSMTIQPQPYTEMVLNCLKGQLKEEVKVPKESSSTKVFSTDLGQVVSDFLVENFPKVVDYSFTANVEKELDHIAEGEKEWNNVISNFYSVFHTNITDVDQNTEKHRIGERVLGIDPTTGLVVSARVGRYGPLVQLGSNEKNGSKPLFASLNKHTQSIETITLEEALVLLSLPREIGKYDDATLTVKKGPFGPYLQWGKVNIKIPEGHDPYTMKAEEAVEIIQEKIKEDARLHVATYGKGKEEIRVMRNKFTETDLYIVYKKKLYKLPQDAEAQLSEEYCKAVIAGEIQVDSTIGKRSKKSQ